MGKNGDDSSEKQGVELDQADNENNSPEEHEEYLDEAYDKDSSETEESGYNESDDIEDDYDEKDLRITPIQINEDKNNGHSDSSEAFKKSPKLILLILLIVLIVGYGAYSFLLSGPLGDGQETVQMPPTNRSSIKPPAPVKVKPTEPSHPEKKPVNKKMVQKTVSTPLDNSPSTKPSLEESIEPDSVIEKSVDSALHSREPAPGVITSTVNKKVKVVKAPLPVKNEKGYFVQAGVFIFRQNANTVKESIESLGYAPSIKVGRKPVKMRRVTVGKWNDVKQAEAASKKLNDKGYSSKVLKIGETTYAVLVGSYYYKNIADEEKIILNAKGYDAETVIVPVDMKAYHVLMGPYKTLDEAVNMDVKLKNNKIDSVIIQPVRQANPPKN